MEKIKEFLKYLNDNPRIKAIFKLGLWLIFFATIFVVFYIISLIVPQKPNNSTKKQDIIKTIEVVASSNYEFEYNIKVNDNKIKMNGQKYNDIMRFYKEDNGNIVKYQIEGEHAYQIIGDYFEPITDNIYGDIEIGFIDLNSIISLLSTYQYRLVDNNYEYDLIDRKVVITDSKTSLKITITTEANSYELSYRNYNEVEEIKRISD